MSGEDGRPDGARVTAAMIGSTTGDLTVKWDERDLMLYAVGIGAGLGTPDKELHFTTENTADVSFAAVPSYVTTLPLFAKPPALFELDAGRFLHAEQRFFLHAPLPRSGKGILRNTVHEIFDKGSGAIIVNQAQLRDAEDGQPLAEMQASIFVRGAGGFDGPRGAAEQWALPARAPDARVSHATRVEQPLLYRLSGDRHRLHSDPGFARRWGFEGPILHGLCTYGFVCRALVAAAAGGNANLLRGMGGRFRKPVMPGDTLTTEIWCSEGSILLFRTLDGNGDVVLDRGTAELTPALLAVNGET